MEPMKLFLICLCIASFPASALGRELGRVVFSKKGETALRKGEKLDLKNGTKILKGDVVQVPESGLLILKLPWGVMKIPSRSELALSEENEVTLRSGASFFKVTPKKINHFRVRTRTAVMGVRGTEFFVAYGKKSKESEDVWMCVNEGSVDVTASKKGSQALNVPAGKGIFLNQKEGTTAPKAYAWTKDLNWNVDATRGDIEKGNSIKGAYEDLMDQDYD